MVVTWGHVVFTSVLVWCLHRARFQVPWLRRAEGQVRTPHRGPEGEPTALRPSTGCFVCANVEAPYVGWWTGRGQQPERRLGGSPAEGASVRSSSGASPTPREPASSDVSASTTEPDGHAPAVDGKRPFDINVVVGRLREVVRPLPQAALFQLADEGYISLFEQLVACIISIRTLDEATLPMARRLFAVARTPAAVARLGVLEIDRLIGASTFHESKARQIHTIATVAAEQYGGVLPCDRDMLLGFKGVGPKCANLALGIACGVPHIGVDVHVHRVTNRWGYVHARSPEATMMALEAVLPRQYWLEINRLLVPFGKHICTRTIPKCSTCALLDMCQQVGVTTHR
ncbi:MAG: endonuclease III [Chloroflexi bacterium]|nr:endonuclease III [Chloroflexota bacterium]